MEAWDLVLNTLSLRDAFRTSALSHEWRNCCLNLEKLVFDYNLFTGTHADQLTGLEKLRTIVYPVLMCHRANIKEFVLGFYSLPDCTELDVIIRHLLINHATLQKFVLHVHDEKKYMLPSSFLELNQLSHLELFGCAIQPPRLNYGSSVLTNLGLFNVTCTVKVLVSFLCNCPNLKNLRLLSPLAGLSQVGLLEFALSIPNIEHLRLSSSPFHLFSKRGSLEKHNAIFTKLRTLDLTGVVLTSARDIRAIMFLVTNSPKLEKVWITGTKDEGLPDLVHELYSSEMIMLNSLVYLEIKFYTYGETVMDLIKFILIRSPKMKKVQLRFALKMSAAQQRKIMNDLSRASSNLDINISFRKDYIVV